MRKSKVLKSKLYDGLCSLGGQAIPWVSRLIMPNGVEVACFTTDGMEKVLQELQSLRRETLLLQRDLHALVQTVGPLDSSEYSMGYLVFRIKRGQAQLGKELNALAKFLGVEFQWKPAEERPAQHIPESVEVKKSRKPRPVATRKGAGKENRA